ncbi:MAG: glycosyltransferase family 4 protein [Bacteroidia bacterium]
MKILQVSNRVPWPLNEGGTIGIYNYTRAYSQLGHEVTFYCLDGYKHNTPVDEATKELEKYAKLFIHPIDTDVHVEEAIKHLLRNESYNVSRFYNRIFELELEKLLNTEKFDVVQLEGTFVGPYLPVIKKNHKGLISLRMHNVEYEIWERLATNDKNIFKGLYLKRLAKQLKNYESNIIKEVDVIVPVTDDDGLKFKKLHPNGKYHTIPAGIDLGVWKYAPSDTMNRWYHIGSMEWHANAEAVSWFVGEIHPLISSRSTSYHLHLAGKGIDSFDLKGNQMKVDSYVPDAYEFVKENDVCVVPLKSGSGIRLKILEAMAAGKLVVSTTIGAQGIQYEKGTHLLIADTPEEFANVFDDLKSGRIDYKSIISNGRKLIEENYSTEALAHKQLEVYKKLL